MNGITVETVASSWIEALGGLSHRYMRSVPPGFCADAELATSTHAITNAAIATGRWRTFSSLLGAPQGAPLWPAQQRASHLRAPGLCRHGRGVASARRRARRRIERLGFARAERGKQAV